MNMKIDMKVTRHVITMVLFWCFGYAGAQDVTWHAADRPATYTVTKNADAVVQTAIGLWKNDLLQVTGVQPTAAKEGSIRIVQLDKDPSAVKQLRAQGVPVDSLIGHHDGFWIGLAANLKPASTPKSQVLLVVGNNKRGTAYGVLELSRLAGVSPWVWWSNVTPEKKRVLSVSKDYETLQVASVEYRGIFINDEDWTLQPWSWQHYEAGAPAGRMGARTYRRVFELLMRLRANAVWPGMHGISTPFYLVPGAKEQADSCGIIIGSSHCEPLARNNVGEWKESERGPYNYLTNGDQVRTYWTERLQETRGLDNIYTIGMRGIHDGPMEGVSTMQEKTEWLQRVIDDQRELLKKFTNKDVTKVPQQFVPYKEVLSIMENGLEVPEDVMLTWCDDNYGYMTRLSDAAQQKRSGGGGVYYHLSYWGRPMDYMWLATTQPGLVYNEMNEAYRHNVRRLWIVNVHELKVAAYPLEFFLDRAWNIDGIQPATISRHLGDWLCREFGRPAGEKLLPAMLEYYRLTAIRRPEFMGWNQVEVSSEVYPRGWTPVANTAFSFSSFGDEADRYIEAWQRICRQVDEAGQLVAADRADAFFSHIGYQVHAAASMVEKMLEAQRARALAAGTYNAARWRRDDQLFGACARSLTAYQNIRRLTDYWNNDMAAGFWKGTMCMIPRDLYQFYAPQLPFVFTDEEVERYRAVSRPVATPMDEVRDGSFVACNAAGYDRSSVAVEAVQMLGHSMEAIPLPKGQTLGYDFTTESEGESVLYVALIPTQPNDTGDLRFSVSIDGGTPQICSLKEEFRSEQWKLNVLRGQALKTFPVTLQKGSHRLEIKAIDDHIVVDQWMIDFKKDRKFYVIPVGD